MAEISKHKNGYNTNGSNQSQYKCIVPSDKTKQKPSPIQQISNNSNNENNTYNQFVSKVKLCQTNPSKPNYTIYVKIVINPKKREAQEIRFPFKPDKESLESVIDEMIDALQLNKNIHHKIIVQSIQNVMKTKKMAIVKASPLPNKKSKESTTSNSMNLSPKKHMKNMKNMKDENEEFIFSPLSPLVVSPRTIHRNSNTKFPNLRIQSNSMSDSDPLSLIKQIKYQQDEDGDKDLYYNTHSNSNSHRNLLDNNDIDQHYIDKYIPNDTDIITNQAIVK